MFAIRTFFFKFEDSKSTYNLVGPTNCFSARVCNKPSVLSPGLSAARLAAWGIGPRPAGPGMKDTESDDAMALKATSHCNKNLSSLGENISHDIFISGK